MVHNTERPPHLLPSSPYEPRTPSEGTPRGGQSVRPVLPPLSRWPCSLSHSSCIQSPAAPVCHLSLPHWLALTSSSSAREATITADVTTGERRPISEQRQFRWMQEKVCRGGKKTKNKTDQHFNLTVVSVMCSNRFKASGRVWVRCYTLLYNPSSNKKITCSHSFHLPSDFYFVAYFLMFVDILIYLGNQSSLAPSADQHKTLQPPDWYIYTM